MNDNTPKRPTTFEGRPVEAVKWKVSGTAPLDDLDGEIVSTDDRVQMLAIFTVTGISHEVDKNGNLVRVQTIKAVDMHLMPFDENDPKDDGILRAMVPGIVTSSTHAALSAPADAEDAE